MTSLIKYLMLSYVIFEIKGFICGNYNPDSSVDTYLKGNVSDFHFNICDNPSIRYQENPNDKYDEFRIDMSANASFTYQNTSGDDCTGEVKILFDPNQPIKFSEIVWKQNPSSSDKALEFTFDAFNQSGSNPINLFVRENDDIWFNSWYTSVEIPSLFTLNAIQTFDRIGLI